MKSSLGDLPPADRTHSTHSVTVSCVRCVWRTYGGLVDAGSHSGIWSDGHWCFLCHRGIKLYLYLPELRATVRRRPSPLTWFKNCDKLRVTGFSGEIYQLIKVIANRSPCEHSVICLPRARRCQMLISIKSHIQNIVITKNSPSQGHYNYDQFISLDS